MHWAIFILIGTAVNVVVNLGYKTLATKTSIFIAAACVMLVASLCLFAYGFSIKQGKIADLAQGTNIVMITGMGVGTAIVLTFLVNALSKGPISLVDPLWACLYALFSVALGMVLLREAPSINALAGIGLYVVGAFLMARG